MQIEDCIESDLIKRLDWNGHLNQTVNCDQKLLRHKMK